jgi:hypothetical protein
VYAAEQWKPATGQWTTLASMQVTRQYHSTALLLPDGRVLSAGGGLCGTCDAVGYEAKNAEIFSPPYLFTTGNTLASRPTISSAPTSVDYGATMRVGTPSPSAIRKVALVRLGSVTHSDNMEQRYIPLSFRRGTSRVTATAPANANIAPPGMYMLFILDSNGVPSVARMVSIKVPAAAAAAPAPALTAPAPARVCTPALAASRSFVAGGRLAVRYRACGASRVTAELQRQTAGGRRTVERVSVRVRAAGPGRLRLSLRHVRPGRYRLRALLADTVLSRQVVVVRAHAARR